MKQTDELDRIESSQEMNERMAKLGRFIANIPEKRTPHKREILGEFQKGIIYGVVGSWIVFILMLIIANELQKVNA